MRPLDEVFITSSWVSSFKWSKHVGVIPNHAYHDIYESVVGEILDRKGIEVAVAVNPEEPDPRYEIYGYIVAETGFKRPVVHYLYVKEVFRNQGVARSLLAHAGIDHYRWFYYTFKTDVATRLCEPEHGSSRYNGAHNPQLARYPKPKDKPE